jgi:hypothetical protein
VIRGERKKYNKSVINLLKPSRSVIGGVIHSRCLIVVKSLSYIKDKFTQGKNASNFRAAILIRVRDTAFSSTRNYDRDRRKYND